MPIREFLCRDCGHVFEEIVRHPEDMPSQCNHCESIRINILPSAVGGYQIHGNNGGSTRPKSAGSFKRTK